MRFFFLCLWQKVANLAFTRRLIVKLSVFCVILLGVLYPNPILLTQQISHYMDMEALIQTEFQGLDKINREIDTLLPSDASPQKEFLTIQHYVYQHIQYAYDWENWGNLDFWPTAEQVWERKREDCDGQAILAASILRSRGFKTASLVGSIRHIWVKVDQQELMGPDKERNIRYEGGRIVMTLPSFMFVVDSMALYIAEFPSIRNLLLFFTILVLCYHPCKNLVYFLGITTLGLIGLILLKDWAHEVIVDQIEIINMNFISGCGLSSLSIFLALFTEKIFIRRTPS